MNTANAVGVRLSTQDKAQHNVEAERGAAEANTHWPKRNRGKPAFLSVPLQPLIRGGALRPWLRLWLCIDLVALIDVVTTRARIVARAVEIAFSHRSDHYS